MAALTPLPTPPNSGNPATFSDDADVFLGVLPRMVSEINALLPTLASAAYAAYGGSGNRITLTADYPDLVRGAQVRFRATSTNTGAATLNLDGLGAKPCVTITGAELPAGYIRTDVDTVATYDGTYWVVDRQIESGYNSNGRYVRWADGTQVCASPRFMADATTAFGALWRTDEQVWVYPASFADASGTSYGVYSSGFVTPGNAMSVISASMRPVSLATATTAAFTASSTAGRGWCVSAIGNWY